jgi:hypothetical protein
VLPTVGVRLRSAARRLKPGYVVSARSQLGSELQRSIRGVIAVTKSGRITR